MFKGATKSRVIVTAAIAAMWLTACGGGGGGGGDSVAGAPAPAPAGQGTGAPAPAPAPVQALSWNAALDATGAALAAQSYHWVTTNDDGSIMAASTIPGQVYLSTNAGANWAPAGDLPSASWISLDMVPDGSKMVAVGFGGAMFISNNGGVNWTRVDALFNPAQDLQYESVAMSSDGNLIMSVELNGPVRRSIDGGVTFGTAVGSVVGNISFRAIDMTPTGSVVVAASQDGSAHISTDGGASFSALNVSVGGVPVTDGWYRTKVSTDGNTIVLAGNSQFTAGGSGIYVSKDRGLTWTQASTASGTFSGIGMSADGGIIAATLSDNPGTGAPGTVLLSTNGGTSFATMATLPAETNWRSIAISGDGARAVLAAGTFFGATGGLYTSSGSLGQ